jgi:hypothetical protein
MQHLSTVDTIVVLALLQEEMLDSSRKKELCHPDTYQWAKLPPRAPQPLLAPAGRADRQERVVGAVVAAEDRRSRDVDAKLNTLHDCHRAHGLCIRCGEKWSRDHRCPEHIQLHVLQEVWDLCHSDISEDCDDAAEDTKEAHVFLALSIAAFSARPSDSTMQFVGEIQGQSVQILINSGSSNTFMSTSLASKLSSSSPCQYPIKVTVANGTQLICEQEFKHLQWTVQQCSFFSDVKVLPLSQYDLIVGMDWLIKHNPMEIDWKYKRILISYGSERVLLQGVLAALPAGLVLHVIAVTNDLSNGSEPSLPPAVTDLLAEYQDVFAPPAGYPPTRHCNHEIPLLPGAAPVQVRPYRYPPAVKDEIERQVSEMLSSGLIQPSSSPFSSVVLLVKKKDGFFQFCVDFRQLNAITAKSKYPVPMIEELLYELQGVS